MFQMLEFKNNFLKLSIICNIASFTIQRKD